MISLCLIVGNVAEYIERCLRSFAPVADEIVLVRAIGSQKPDNTIELARQVCAEVGKPLVIGEYRNAEAHQDWPHVDSFAAARQMSFDLAAHPWAFWCDTDDVLEAGAEKARALAQRGGFAGFVMPYKIIGRGVSVPRERLILREAGRWAHPVHECFEFKVQPPRVEEASDVIVTHVPHLTKTGSNERNLRILRSIPETEMTAGLWYHLHGELTGAGDIEGSIAAAKKALASPDIGTPERYELFLNLSRISKDPNVKASFLHQAYAADPKRREALGMLVCNSLDYGNNADGLAYARQMDGTPAPPVADWNDRAGAYGWLGDDILAQALRANGLAREAEDIRRRSLAAAGGPRIALLHATRGRAVQASRARKAWLDLAERPEQVEHIFVFDADDKESEPLSRMHHLRIEPGGGCVAAWNHALWATAAPVVVQLSDDWVPTPYWDSEILKRIGDVNQPAVLAISDGLRNDQLLCMAIATRAYCAQDGFLFHPQFTGVYSDNYFTNCAYARGQVIEARDLVFTHDHPAGGKKPSDATYEAQNAPARYAEGERVMKWLASGRDWSTVPGFFNYIGFYDQIAKWLKDGDTVAEVGVFKGRSLAFLAQACQRAKKRVHIFAVDNFTDSGRPEFEANLDRCGVRDMVTIIESDSAEAAKLVPDNLAFAWIDAAHDYDSVKRDLCAWRGKIRKGGILAGHDAQHEPVMRAVREDIPKARPMGCLWAMFYE